MIETNPTYRDLLSAIEADPDNAALKLIMSEFCSDQGEDDLAFAYRWCADNGKWPESMSIYQNCSHHWWLYEIPFEYLPRYAFLSAGIYEQLGSSSKGWKSAYDSPHEAISDLSRVLKEQNAKLENHSQPQKRLEDARKQASMPKPKPMCCPLALNGIHTA